MQSNISRKVPPVIIALGTFVGMLFYKLRMDHASYMTGTIVSLVVGMASVMIIKRWGKKKI